MLADTNRFNEAMGLPPYTLEETPQPNGTVLRRGRRQGGGLHARMGGKALRVDHGSALPPGARVHQRPIPTVRSGVRSSNRTAKGGSRGHLRTRVGAAAPWSAALFGARLATQAGENVAKRVLEAVAFAQGDHIGERLTPIVLAGTRTAPRRARAGRGAGT